MAAELTAIEREDQIGALLEESRTRPVVIFSSARRAAPARTPPTSCAATWPASPPTPGSPWSLCRPTAGSVTPSRPRLGVRHETPQILVVRDGQVAWHGSHFHVTADALAQALTAAPAAR